MPVTTRASAAAAQRAKVASFGRRIEEHTSGFERTCVKLPDGVKMFAPKKAGGSFRIEVIPYTAGEMNKFVEPGDLAAEFTYFNHPRIGANQDAYACPARMWGEPCPICELRQKMAAQKDADAEMLQALAPKERQLWNVFDHAEPEKGVQVWEISYHLFGKHLELKIKNADPQDQDAYMMFHDPEHGMTLRIGAAEKSFGKNTFLEFSDIEFRQRTVALDPDLFAQAVDLETAIVKIPYEQLKRILMQEPADQVGQEETPAPAQPARRAAPAAPAQRPAAPTQRPATVAARPAAPVKAAPKPPPPPPVEREPTYEVGGSASFTYKGKKLVGEITVVDEEKGMFGIDCQDRPQPHWVAFDDESLAWVSNAPDVVEEQGIEEEDTPAPIAPPQRTPARPISTGNRTVATPIRPKAAVRDLEFEESDEPLEPEEE